MLKAFPTWPAFLFLHDSIPLNSVQSDNIVLIIAEFLKVLAEVEKLQSEVIFAELQNVMSKDARCLRLPRFKLLTQPTAFNE